MSKRKSQTAVSDYVDQGFIREALVNYLALLGWATGTEEEILSLDEIVERFDLDAVHKGGAVFDRERLEWLNGQWIRRLDADELIDRLRPFVEAEPVPAGSTGCRRTMSSVRCSPSSRNGCRPWVPSATSSASCGSTRCWSTQRPSFRSAGTWPTTQVALPLRARSSPPWARSSFEADELEPPLRALAEARGWKAGDLFMAIRVAVTGRTATPPLFDTLVALGRERTLAPTGSSPGRARRHWGRAGVIVCRSCRFENATGDEFCRLVWPVPRLGRRTG